MKKFLSQGALVMAFFALAVGLSACGGGSVVSNSSSNPSGSNPSGAKSSGNATGAQPGSSPTVGTSGGSTESPATSSNAARQATPSPTMNPVIKEAQAKPGVPVAVPESMRRPLNAQEMEKALQAMPPEVRARIQGMRAAPPGVVPVQPQATPKK